MSADNPLRLANVVVRKAFEGKTDKNGVPYIMHLTTVAQNARDSYVYGKDINPDHLEMAGLLHDILEDCPDWTEGALRSLFPEAVVDAVVALTKLPTDQSYRAYIERVMRNDIARMVKIADLKHNMDVTRHKEWDDVDLARMQKYHKAYVTLTRYNEAR